MQSSDKPTYLIDTCVWVNIRDVHADSDKIWDQIVLLIEVDIIKTVRHVYDELERKFPDIHARLKPHRKELLIDDAELYSLDAVAELRAIRAQHPGLYDQLGAHNPADPFLIAVAKTKSAIVVTDERHVGKGHKSKIPYVCTQRNVGWMDRLAFFLATGIAHEKAA